MMWLVYIVMLYSEDFAVEYLKFKTRDECFEFIKNPDNSLLLGIEVGSRAGFDDTVVAIGCIPDNVLERTEEREKIHI